MNAPTLPIGALLRHWRQRRRLSQLDLACSADISTRHLSFVETGRAQPSREMLLHLAEHLEIPLRERNRLLASAGFARSTRSTASTTRPWMPPARPSGNCSRPMSRTRPWPSTGTGTCWPPTTR